MIESVIFKSFCDLQVVMLGVQRAWTNRRQASGLEHAIADARHHCCCAAAFLDDFEQPCASRRSDVYDQLTDVDRMVAHEAYISLIALGQMMSSALEDHLPGTAEIGRALYAIGRLLDTLEPFASRADIALRAVVLEGEPVEHFIEPRRAS